MLKEGQRVWYKLPGGQELTYVRYLREGFYLMQVTADKELRVLQSDEFTTEPPKNPGTNTAHRGFTYAVAQGIAQLAGLRSA